MTWKIKYNLFNRHILMHKHGNVWAESYKKERDYFCCECDSKYESPHVAALTGVTARPNNRTYFEIYELFKGKVLRINPQPCTDISKWDSYGHTHEYENDKNYKNVKWKARDINGKVCCPECLELAPEGVVVDASPVSNPLRQFGTNVWVNKDPENPEEMWNIQYV